MVEIVVHEDPATVLIVSALWQSFKDHYLLIPIFIVFIRFIVHRYSSPLRSLPGPFLASGSRIWKVWSTYRGHTEQDHINLHREYGPAVRIAPNEVSLSSPTAAKEVFTAGRGFYKTDFYGVFPPISSPDIFTEVREDIHAAKKRFAASPYSMASMSQMTKFIENTEVALTTQLDSFSRSGTVCDLGDYLHFFAFDVLGEVAFSRKFGFLDAGYDLENAIKTIDDSQRYNGIVGQIPFVDKFLRRNPLLKWLPWTEAQDSLITRMARKELKQRKQLGHEQIDERKDLLSQLISAHKSQPERFTENDVFAVSHGAIFAGSDSTASTMQSFFYHVLKEPRVYGNILKELDEADKSGKLSDFIQFQQALQLPYFQASLKEAMRVRPAVGLNITRHVPRNGVELDGRFYRAGTIVALNGWVLHRDKQIFGDDADDYRPERWFERDSKLMDRHMYQFGGGSHLCIGKNLALLEINMTIPQLLRMYKFDLVHPNMIIQHQTTFFVVQSGLKVTISKRDQPTHI